MKKKKTIMDQWFEEGIQMGSEEARRNSRYCFDVGRSKTERIRLKEEANSKRKKLSGARCQDKVHKDTAFLNKAGGGKPKAVIETSVTRGKIELFGAIALMLGSYAFVLLALAPYRLAIWLQHLIAMVFAIGTCLSLDRFLFYCHTFKKNVIKFSVSAAVVFLILLAQSYFAVVRGNLFIEQAKSLETTPVVEVTGGGEISEAPSGEGFYSKSARPLSLALILACLGFELGAGFLLFSAKERLLSPEVSVSREIEAMNDKMELYLGEIEEGEQHHLIFWEGFQVGAKRVLGAAKRKGNRSKNLIAVLIPVVVILLILIAFLTSNVFGATDETIIAFDLTKSTKVEDQQGESQFDKNKRGVEEVLLQVNPGDKITVIGITDRSFSNPFFIMQARVGDDPGYFGEKLERARKKILLAWRERSKDIRPVFLKTDLLGALLLSSTVFEGSKDPDKSLYIFSDFRHCTGEVDIEYPGRLYSESILEKVEKLGLIAPLEGVKVYALGVHTYGKIPAYWMDLKRFWVLYFEKACADLKTFSIAREVTKYDQKD